MKMIHKIASVLIVVLGFVHIGFTFHDYDGFSMEAVWFVGSGVAIILAGFINIASLRDEGKDAVIWSMCLVTNIFFLLGFVAAAYMMSQPQVFVGAMLFAFTTINSFVVNPKTG